MSKSRMMGAGNASASLYKTNPNINTFGGSKKQDIPTRVGIDAWANYGYQTNANGIGRNKLFIMNQIGGVGVGRSMFNTSYVQPRGLRKIVDISDIAYWDGVQHVLKKNVIIPVGHSLTTTSTFTVGQGTTLTVHGNFKSQGHIIVKGVLNVIGNHYHKKMTIASTGSYIVSGNAMNLNNPILKTIIDDTETDVADVNNQGTFEVKSGGNYTNASTLNFNNLGPTTTESAGNFSVDLGGQFTNAGTFTNSYGSIFTMNGTYTNNGTLYYKSDNDNTTSVSTTNVINGTFSNNGTLQLSLDTGATSCEMKLYSVFSNSGTIIIDADCWFVFAPDSNDWTNSGTINNSGYFYVGDQTTLTNNGTITNNSWFIIHYTSISTNSISHLINKSIFNNPGVLDIMGDSTQNCTFTNDVGATFNNTGSVTSHDTNGTPNVVTTKYFINYGTSNYTPSS